MFFDNKEKEVNPEIKRMRAAERLIGEAIGIIEHPAVVSVLPEFASLSAFLKKTGITVFFSPGMATNARNSPEFQNLFRFSPELGSEHNSILLYPLYSHDAKEHKLGEYYVKRVEFAGYGPESNCIIVNMSSGETSRMLACSFLHELWHAQAAHCEGRIFKPSERTEQERLREEAAVWSMEYKLMLALGGADYCQTVVDLASQICRLWFLHKSAVDIKWEGRGQILDRFLGKPVPGCRIHRDVSFCAYCLLMAADIFFPPGPARDAQKIQIVDSGRYGEKKESLKRVIRDAP